jgi:hypothetical protein
MLLALHRTARVVEGQICEAVSQHVAVSGIASAAHHPPPPPLPRSQPSALSPQPSAHRGHPDNVAEVMLPAARCPRGAESP